MIMLVRAIKSKIITPGDDLAKVLLKSLKKTQLKDKDVLVITSKVVAVTQGRIKKVTSDQDFRKLVKREADKVIGDEIVLLTIKNGICIPWAGIDRSNSKPGEAILWPEQPFKEAEKICKALKKHFKIKKLGVLITDSTCLPLRRGVSAVALGYAGFKGVEDLRGIKDLYGKPLQVTQQNKADMLAVSAHMVMGEAAESTPFALIRGAGVTFTTKKIDPKEPIMSPDQCLYKPLYKKGII
jgi:coenzyme F420-0:L-glutamate ligase